MTAAKIYFELDGKPTPIDDCSWLLYSPCGCMSGISVVREDVMTEDQAWKSFTPNAEQRRRDKADGCRVVLGHRSDAKKLTWDCPHEPKWGVEKAPIPDGHQWARTLRFPQGRRKHIVPDIAVENYAEHRHGAGNSAALCGSEGWSWTVKAYDLDVPECLACVREAKKTAAGGEAAMRDREA